MALPFITRAHEAPGQSSMISRLDQLHALAHVQSPWQPAPARHVAAGHRGCRQHTILQAAHKCLQCPVVRMPDYLPAPPLAGSIQVSWGSSWQSCRPAPMSQMHHAQASVPDKLSSMLTTLPQAACKLMGLSAHSDASGGLRLVPDLPPDV